MPITSTPYNSKTKNLHFEIRTLADAVSYFSTVEKRDHANLVSEDFARGHFLNLETGEILERGKTYTTQIAI